MPSGDQVFMGTAVACGCLLGLWYQRWFLTETPKGQRLVRRFGEEGGAWVFRGLLLVGLLLGVLLAVGVIHPIKWD